MYESYSLAIAESSVKQNLENRLKIIDSLCLGAIWELWGLGQREAGLQGLRASRRQGWSLGHPEQGALPRGVGLPWRLSSKKSTCSTRDAGSISELRRCPGSRNGNPSPYSCLKNRVDREAWQATGYVVTESQTQLKRLSSSYHQKRQQTVNGTTHLKNTEACLQPFLSHISEPWTAFRRARGTQNTAWMRCEWMSPGQLKVWHWGFTHTKKKTGKIKVNMNSIHLLCFLSMGRQGTGRDGSGFIQDIGLHVPPPLFRAISLPSGSTLSFHPRRLLGTEEKHLFWRIWSIKV